MFLISRNHRTSSTSIVCYSVQYCLLLQRTPLKLRVPDVLCTMQIRLFELETGKEVCFFIWFISLLFLFDRLQSGWEIRGFTSRASPRPPGSRQLAHAWCSRTLTLTAARLARTPQACHGSHGGAALSCCHKLIGSRTVWSDLYLLLFHYSGCVNCVLWTPPLSVHPPQWAWDQ